MRFKINCTRLIDGKPTYWIFDTLTLDIFSEKGVEASLDTDFRFNKFRLKTSAIHNKPFNKDHPLVGKHNLKKIKLSLGFKCNFNCSYCWQAQFRQDAFDANPWLIDDFINKLKKLDLSKVERLDIWGGEPLVYWKTLQYLIPKIRENWPHIRIFVLSNGSLFKHKFLADFFIENKVLFGISHDAQAFSVCRDKSDPLDDPECLETIKYYCKKNYEVNHEIMWFAVVVSKHNLNLDQVYSFFREKLGDDVPYRVHPENTVETSDEADFNLHSFTDEETQYLQTQLCNIYLNPKHPLHESMKDNVQRAISVLVNKLTPYQFNSGCDMPDRRTLALNMNGDIISCHSFPADKVGRIENLDKVKITKFTSWDSREQCKKCPILPICHGGKPCVSEENQRWLCKELIAWRYPAFIAAWMLIFEAKIDSIEEYNG